jgi:hypothetical protein
LKIGERQQNERDEHADVAIKEWQVRRSKSYLVFAFTSAFSAKIARTTGRSAYVHAKCSDILPEELHKHHSVCFDEHNTRQQKYEKEKIGYCRNAKHELAIIAYSFAR